MSARYRGIDDRNELWCAECGLTWRLSYTHGYADDLRGWLNAHLYEGVHGWQIADTDVVVTHSYVELNG